MAERCEDIIDLRAVPKAGRYGRYDWKSWADGSVWRLAPADFPGTDTEGMRRLVHAHAKRLGTTAVTRIDPEDSKSLLVQFRPGDAEGPRAGPGGR